MAVNYGLLEPVNIAGNMMAGQQQAQQNQLAQQQAEMRKQEFGMRQQEFAAQAEDRQLKLADYKTKQAGLDKFLELSVANGKTGSPKEMAGSFYEYALTQRDPQLIMAAQTMMQTADEREKYDAISKSQQPIPAQQTPAPMADEFGTGTALPGMFNALASQVAAPMASTNALAAPKAADPVAAIDSQIALYENLKDPRAKDKVARLQKQRDELTKRYTVGNTLMNQMGNVLGTAPKEAAITPLAKLRAELAALPPGDPDRSYYLNAIRKETQFAPTSSTTVNMPVQEKAEQGERGKMLVTEYSDISKAAKLAVKTLPSIDSNLNILNKGFETGFGTETIASAAKVLAALGVPNAEKFATNAQLFQAKASESILQKQLEQRGVQTQSDKELIEKTGAQLGATTQGNKFLLSVAKEQLKRDIEQRNFYDAWWKKNKTYDGAEDAWFSGEGGKSLFDRPELKAYKEPTATAAETRPSLNKIFGKRP
jgi:hypothetical protein